MGLYVVKESVSIAANHFTKILFFSQIKIKKNRFFIFQFCYIFYEFIKNFAKAFCG
ncbi:holo-[acyl-carrier-protein] synthase [Capnocytophaga sp. oral taxon 338 str. F0234]|nr:holo-[acyl-carrier-protein] synthase [Capnocytophaga sp. oral taxon 338 str. F0234]